MIDAIYASLIRLKDKPLDSAYNPVNAINGRKLTDGKSNKLVVIFPGWHSHKFPVNVLARRLLKDGWTVLAYDFNDQILEPDEDIVVESFRQIQKTIAGELRAITSKHKYDAIQLVGISLGNVPLTLVADKFVSFTGATLVVAGDDLAIDMWYGMRTQAVQKAFQKMHIGVRKLDKDWDSVSPINHVRNFAGKKINILISLNDHFVGTKYQKKLADRIIKTGADTGIKTSRLGHILSIVRFCYYYPLIWD